MSEQGVPPVPSQLSQRLPVELPDHELEELEVDSSVPPRPEEEIADAADG